MVDGVCASLGQILVKRRGCEMNRYERAGKLAAKLGVTWRPMKPQRNDAGPGKVLFRWTRVPNLPCNLFTSAPSH